MLFPGEDADQMLSPDKVQELLAQHVSDPAAIEVIRARVYTHHSRIAAAFVDGRVALAGDAAHLMPPWAGQGMNTGIRDATNLAWKLAAIVGGQADPRLLSSYEEERRHHAQAMIDLSTTLGRILSPTHRLSARTRDLLLRAVTAVPGVRSWVVEMRFKPKPYYRKGFVVPDEEAKASRVGRMFI
jgi:3-(3-hydroxy-phenyl)propionate hydroxylase